MHAQARPEAGTAARGTKRHRTRHRGIYYRNGSDDPNAKSQRRYIVWYADSDGKGRTETRPLGGTEKEALERQAELRG